jgi:phage recombination protein Bet
MSAIVQQKKESIPSLAISESELMDVLRNSLYPGAQDSSIKMVISYCKASGLDPMRKPVHIVPMWDSKTKSMRDVIMPGIGSYRSDAAKSGQYAGVSVASLQTGRLPNSQQPSDGKKTTP